MRLMDVHAGRRFGPHYGSETNLVAELDRNEIFAGKFDLDVAGHYSRPDVFRLTVMNARPRLLSKPV